MHSEDKVWITFWILAALVISIVAINIAAVNVTNSNNITRLVLNGATPVDAYCAIKSETNTARCLVATIGARRD